MSQEAKGSNGLILFCDAYFTEVKRNSGLSRVAGPHSNANFRNAIEEIVDNAKSTVEVIYEDLCRDRNVLPYLPDDDKKETMRLVNAMSNLCKSLNFSEPNRADDALDLLENDRYNSRAGYYEIEDAAKAIDDGISSSRAGRDDREEVLKGVRSYGDDYHSDDEDKQRFFEEVFEKQGSSAKDFAEDVHWCYRYMRSPRDFEGRNGRDLCSRDYCLKLEKELFDCELERRHSYIEREDGYYRYISEKVRRCLNIIKEDVNEAERDGSYMRRENLWKGQEFIEEFTRNSYHSAVYTGMLDYWDKNALVVIPDVLKLQNLLSDMGVKTDKNGLLTPDTIAVMNEFRKIFEPGDAAYKSFKGGSKDVASKGSLEGKDILADEDVIKLVEREGKGAKIIKAGGRIFVVAAIFYECIEVYNALVKDNLRGEEISCHLMATGVEIGTEYFGAAVGGAAGRAGARVFLKSALTKKLVQSAANVALATNLAVGAAFIIVATSIHLGMKLGQWLGREIGDFIVEIELGEEDIH